MQEENNERIFCYCCSTGLRLFELDDNTIAYINECDPSGKMLATIASQQKHPALMAFKNDWGKLADYCPHVFLCYLLHKFIVIPNCQRETYAYVKAMGQVSDSIVDMYEQDIIDDKRIVSMLEHLVLVPVITSEHCMRPAPTVLARFRISDRRYFITIDDIEKLEQDVIAQARCCTLSAVNKTLSSYWQDDHRYVPALTALWGVKETPTETVRRVLKAKTKLYVTDAALEKLDFHYTHPLLEKAKEQQTLLSSLNASSSGGGTAPASSRLDQMMALGALLADARKKNNS